MDRTVARFWAPEIGGHAHPRFITERDLTLEGRVIQAREGVDIRAPLATRATKTALDQLVAETLLVESKQLTDENDAPEKRALIAIFFACEGGRDKLVAAAAALGFDEAEVDAIARRWAEAALRENRQSGTIFSRKDDVLRVAPASAQSGTEKAQGRDDSSTATARRELFDRANEAMATFLQQARSHVTVISSRHE